MSEEQKLMSNIQEVALKKALVLLKASGCMYHVVDMDGNHYGEAIVDKKKRAPSKYDYGSVRTYIRPYVENLEEGQIVEIPVGAFDIDAIQNGAGSLMVYLYGPGRCITTRSDDNQFLQMIFLGRENEQQNENQSVTT